MPRVLSEEQCAAFVETGFVRVSGAFSPTTAEALVPHVWHRLSENPHYPTTWTQKNRHIEEVLTCGPADDIFTDRYRASIDELVGRDRWVRNLHGFGWVVLRFPLWESWHPPQRGWHVDGMHFHHHLRSPEQGLVGIEMLTDIEPRGGGTAVRVGSHKEIARALFDAQPEGLSYDALKTLADRLQHLPVVEVVGRAGDVLWMHPFTAHARSPNTRSTVRIIANRCIALREPMCLDRAARGERSLVEQAIIDALDGHDDHHGSSSPS